MTKIFLKKASLIFFIGLLSTGCTNLPLQGTTAGERFRSDLEELEKGCAKSSAARAKGDKTCVVLELQPRDWNHTVLVPVSGQPLPVPQEWLGTSEGKFAHSIQLPKPLPSASGYRPGMTRDEYFHHLCTTEAGKFIYKTVNDVNEIYQARPRNNASIEEQTHLYALEDPAGLQIDGTAGWPWLSWIGKNAYKYIDSNYVGPIWIVSEISRYHSSLRMPPPLGATVSRYWYNEGSNGKVEGVRRDYLIKPKARYGYIWRGIRRDMDRELGIAGGELIALDFSTNEVLAFYRYYSRQEVSKGKIGGRWIGSCDNLKAPTYSMYPIKGNEFLSSVIKPSNQE